MGLARAAAASAAYVLAATAFRAPIPSARRLPRLKAAERWNCNAPGEVEECAVETYGCSNGPSAEYVEVYDTTLRDGLQMEGCSANVDDKLKISVALADFGVHYIEGGWPGSNPKDAEYFARGRAELPAHVWDRVAAFGSTRRKHMACGDDPQMASLVGVKAKTVCIVAKSSDLHVTKILGVTHEENFAMCEESCRYLKEGGVETVMVDLEHFFDGFLVNREHAFSVCDACIAGGADVLVLCDTNGGCMPWEVGAIVAEVVAQYQPQGVRVGIHCHNDAAMAVPNSLEAVRSGASLVQGTINGIGERTGNADLTAIVPSLQLKMGYDVVGANLKNITSLSRFVDERLNRLPDPTRPYVGASAFAHKGGLHASAVAKMPQSYQFVEPDYVGNQRRILVSELSGRSNILSKAVEFGYLEAAEAGTRQWQRRITSILSRVKGLEEKGYTFECADASIDLMIRQSLPRYVAPFKLVDYSLQVWDRSVGGSVGAASVTAGDDGTLTRCTITAAAASAESGARVHIAECADGIGPIDAVWSALHKGLARHFPALDTVALSDFKVRILDQEAATAATTRVVIDFKDSKSGATWTTVAAGANIITAAVSALCQGLEYTLVEHGSACPLIYEDLDAASQLEDLLQDKGAEELMAMLEEMRGSRQKAEAF